MSAAIGAVDAPRRPCGHSSTTQQQQLQQQQQQQELSALNAVARIFAARTTRISKRWRGYRRGGWV